MARLRRREPARDVQLDGDRARTGGLQLALDGPPRRRAARHRVPLLANVISTPKWASSKPNDLYPNRWARRTRDLRGAHDRARRRATARAGRSGRRTRRSRRRPCASGRSGTSSGPRSSGRPAVGDVLHEAAPGAYRAIHRADRGAKVVAGSLDRARQQVHAVGRRASSTAPTPQVTSTPSRCTRSRTAVPVTESVRPAGRDRPAHAARDAPRRDARKPIIITELSWPAARGKIPKRRLLGLETTQKGRAPVSGPPTDAREQAPEPAPDPGVLVRVGLAVQRQQPAVRRRLPLRGTRKYRGGRLHPMPCSGVPVGRRAYRGVPQGHRRARPAVGRAEPERDGGALRLDPSPSRRRARSWTRSGRPRASAARRARPLLAAGRGHPRARRVARRRALLTSARLSPLDPRARPAHRPAGEVRGALRPRPVRPAQDDPRRGPSLLGVAAIVALLHRGHPGARVPRPLAAPAALAGADGRPSSSRGPPRASSSCGDRAPSESCIVGDRATAAAIERKLDGDPALNALVVGRVPARSDPHESTDAPSARRRAAAVLAEHRSSAWSWRRARAGEDVVEEIRSGKACGSRSRSCRGLLEVIGSAIEFDDISGQALLAVRGFGLSRSSQLLKRSLDVVGSGLALVALAAAARRGARREAQLAGPGPLPPDAHRSRGAGVPDAEVPYDGAGRRRPQGRAREHNQAAPLFKIADDPRTTPSGASCGATSSTSCRSSSTSCG